MHSLHGYFLRPGDPKAPTCFSWSGFATAARSVPGGSVPSSTARPSSPWRRRFRPTRPASSTRTRCRPLRCPTTCPLFAVDEVLRQRGLSPIRRVGSADRAARSDRNNPGQGFSTAGLVSAARPAARRSGAAHLRAGLHERSDAAGVRAGHPPGRTGPFDGGVAGSRDVVHAPVPRRRVAALRPVVSVGMRRACPDTRQDLRPLRRDGGGGHAGGPDPLPAQLHTG